MHIVHLEDEGPLREIMQIALTSADPKLTMTQFIDSDNAIEFISENLEDITLFLLDVRVPGALDGMEVAGRIRELGSERPIIITSAYRKPKKAQLETVNAQWMAKPWHIIDAPTTLLPLARGETK
ncbi:MAG: response regulator [Chloroflexota bacterium]